MTSMTSTSRPARPRLLVATGAALLLVTALLAGCSASSGGSNDSGAASGAEAAPAAGAGKGASGSTAGDPTANRQVIQTGTVAVTVDDPRAAVETIVTYVEGQGGRVDDRSEQAERADGSSSATLTVRVPAAKVTATIDHLRGLGKVDSVQLKAQDVTGTAEDLDARIDALQVSIQRLEDFMAKAATTKDLLDAENTLSERQSSLEQLQAQRAQLADQVALSTISITLVTPGVVPAAADHPHSFWGGLKVGWQALVATVKGIVVVLGVLLPWIAFGGAIAAAVVALVRWNRRRRPQQPVPPRGPGGPAYPVAPAVAGPFPPARPGAGPAAPQSPPTPPVARPVDPDPED
jgi:hypothetical protein